MKTVNYDLQMWELFYGELRMKFKVIKDFSESLDESTFNKKNLYHHAIKRQHLYEYRHDPRFPDFNTTGLSELMKKYDEIGDTLSNASAGSPFSTDQIVGFIDKKGRTVKYDRQYGDFIVFTGEETITMFKKTETGFQNTVKRDFLKEIS